jgi:predicted RNA-binding Zn ribbon-like protein
MPDTGQPSSDPQPGGRKPAPDNLRLVQAFVNSNYDLEHEHGAELLGSPEALASWLHGRGLVKAKATATNADLQRARDLREGLRELLIAKREHQHASLTSTVEVGVKLAPDNAAIHPASTTVRAALDLILMQAAAAQLDGSWQRLKACRECSWAFYDHSRNQAGSWCSMKVCGGRVKQRTHYERTRQS